MTRTPSEIVNELVVIGFNKSINSSFKTLLKGILAGLFIALGGVASMKSKAAFMDSPGGASIASAFFFSLGFLLIILLGAELFTGNSLMTIGWFEKRYTFKKLMKNWMLIWVGNLIGALFLIVLLVLAGSFTEAEQHLFVKVAEAKVSYGFVRALFLGILCNIIIVLVVMLQMSARDIPGTILASIFGIMAFFVSGYEHIVANMFYTPLGYIFGGNFTLAELFVNNWIPVTLGNIIGGGVVVPLLFYAIYKDCCQKTKAMDEKTVQAS